MRILGFYLFLLTAILVAASCSGSPGNGAESGSDSPTEAYKRLYAAVKAKDIEAIKQQLSQKTVELAEMSAKRFNKPIEQAYENGFTATTFSATLPTIRDERVAGNMGAIEVWNSRDSQWEDLPYILETGSWKLATGDAFAGDYRSPGKGRDRSEREAANAVSNNSVVMPANIPGNRPANTAANASPR